MSTKKKKRGRGRPAGHALVSLGLRMRADLYPELERQAEALGISAYEQARNILERAAKASISASGKSRRSKGKAV